MPSLKTFYAALIIAVVNARKYKFGVLSDMHLQPNFLPDRSVDQYCEKVTDSN